MNDLGPLATAEVLWKMHFVVLDLVHRTVTAFTEECALVKAPELIRQDAEEATAVKKLTASELWEVKAGWKKQRGVVATTELQQWLLWRWVDLEAGQESSTAAAFLWEAELAVNRSQRQVLRQHHSLTLVTTAEHAASQV